MSHGWGGLTVAPCAALQPGLVPGGGRSMENQTQAFGSPLAEGAFPRGSKLPDYWRMARAAHVDLLLMGMPRVNLLLIAADGVVRFVIESLLLDLQEPIARWKPGERLTLPTPSDGGTL